MDGATFVEPEQRQNTRFFDLPDGSRIAYEEYGNPSGPPVFFFHGWPASRLQGGSCAQAAEELGVRIISPDRPGVGRSTYRANRQLLDWPPVLRALADHLGIETFRIMALSGGAPYALASAWAVPDRIPAIAVVSGAPPLPPGTDQAALFSVYRWLLQIHRKRPSLIHTIFRVARPIVTIRPPGCLRDWMLKMTSRADAEVLARPEVFNRKFEGYREAWRGSASGVVTDAEIYARDWGFPLAGVRVPVRLWHGKDDRNFSWKLAEQVAGQLPNCTAHFVEGEGHYSLGIRHWKEILQDLIAG